MPVLYVDDGSPDSREYDNNYLYYDEDDLERMRSLVAFLERRSARASRPMTAEKRALLRAIEKHDQFTSDIVSIAPGEKRGTSSITEPLRGAIRAFLGFFPGHGGSDGRKRLASGVC